ncbi:MAG TPA: DNA mismatch repair protein MutT [Cyanobacteria bacterium UBA8553]|nr:DNA mismatch repair protein MutT [Cyanobacteria bacterium UBA8553]HAJ62030.1 DNA mismatch repair protein MutT [Cyanobacteria bacterium UBA8543]
MHKIKSCGVIVMRTEPQLSFLLLMKNPAHYDLPKGYIEPGEDELCCALRELQEETGIETSHVHMDDVFRFTITYQTKHKRFDGKTIEKTVVIFLGWLRQEVNLQLSEHSSYTWVTWNPPHTIHKKTIDPLLEQLEQYLHQNQLRT